MSAAVGVSYQLLDGSSAPLLDAVCVRIDEARQKLEGTGRQANGRRTRHSGNMLFCFSVITCLTGTLCFAGMLCLLGPYALLAPSSRGWYSRGPLLVHCWRPKLDASHNDQTPVHNGDNSSDSCAHRLSAHERILIILGPDDEHLQCENRQRPVVHTAAHNDDK